MLLKQVALKYRGLLLITGLLLFTGMILLVFVQHDKQLDEYVFTCIAPYRTDTRTSLMKFVSFYGNHFFLIPANLLLVLYFIIKKNKWMAITAVAVSLSSLGLMSLLKSSFHRHRPANPLVTGITNFSFPSGHAFMSVAFYGLLIWMMIGYTSHQWKQRFTIVFLMLLILMIVFSRIYLRVHYTTDVLAGLGAGTAWLITCLWIIYKIQRTPALP
jgi:membrane-associated phospholipid phosphatase